MSNTNQNNKMCELWIGAINYVKSSCDNKVLKSELEQRVSEIETGI